MITDSDDLEALLTDELNVAGRPASALTSRFDTESDLVDAFRDDPSFTDINGVGDQTATKIWDYLQAEYPEVNRERKERSESYCTEYTTDHELPDESLEDGVTYFAFVCPRCSNTNPLKGDPEGFKNRPFRCETCNWVPLLEGTALEEFAEELERTEVTA